MIFISLCVSDSALILWSWLGCAPTLPLLFLAHISCWDFYIRESVLADPPPSGPLMRGMKRKCNRNAVHSLYPFVGAWLFWTPVRLKEVTQPSQQPAVKSRTTCLLQKFSQDKHTHISPYMFYYLLWSVRLWSAGRSPRIWASPCPWSASSAPSAWCAGRQKPPCRSWV